MWGSPYRHTQLKLTWDPQTHVTCAPTSYVGQNTTSRKLSLSIRSQPIPDVIFWSKRNVKKTFIFNQITTKSRRRILVGTRRQKNFHFQSNHNQTLTSFFGQNATSKKLSFSIRLQPIPDVIFWSERDVKKTLIFNQITTKSRRRILVRT